MDEKRLEKVRKKVEARKNVLEMDVLVTTMVSICEEVKRIYSSTTTL